MNKDKELLDRISMREKDAFDQLTQKYTFYLHRLISRSIHNPREAETLLTEIFKSIWKTPQHYSREKHVSVGITKACLQLIADTVGNSHEGQKRSPIN
ncbi:hypothetical protein GLW00_06775 [Halobacillus litoralis]|uniref:RNA polymerase sigma-70 region 2 domain-containing protein n=1 Tax=Halobacillus litoralis TaxID=45668 RepID=A0A845F9R9_9BACI|nr:hypothetical protein [Halobacillus litoralis]MYL70544.1 hypothetical protein [Halobacillus litoralis]